MIARASYLSMALVTLLFSFLLGWTVDANGADLDPRRPAAIETHDVPSVPPQLFAKLQQYQNVRSAAFRGWAPDGTGILISTRFGNSSQLHRVYEPGGRREQVTFFEEPVSGTFIPHATDGSIVMLMDTGGNENDQIYLLDRKSFRTTLLTDGKSRNKLGAISRDGTKMVVTSNQRNGRDVDLYLADPRQSNSFELIMQVEKQTWNAVDWSPDGKTLLIQQYVSANETYPALLDVESGKRTSLTLAANTKSASGPMSYYDNASILVATDVEGEFRCLSRKAFDSKTLDWMSADLPWDVSDLAVAPDNGDVAFTINEDGASRLYLIPRGLEPRREFQLPLGIISGLEFSPDYGQLGFTLSCPDAPADAYSLELESGKLIRWTYSEVGGLDPASFISPTRIQFRSFDGRMIPAYYFKPRTTHEVAASKTESTKRVPVLISIHGGPESQYQPFFSPMIQFYLNELGIAVICPNVRGSSGYGKTYLTLDNAEKREDSVRDIGALLDWVATQPELDANRVAVTGGSYGGYMTLASLVHFGNRIKAGIDVVGIANFVSFLEKTAPYRVDLRRVEYGDERDPAMKAVFEKISPLNHADKIQAALLVIHGRNDPRVPFFEAEQIAAKVRARKHPVWTVFANNEGHGFSKRDNSDYQRAVEVLFLKRHLNLE